MTRNNPTQIRLPAGLKLELDEYVKAAGQTRSSFVREAIAAYASGMRGAEESRNVEERDHDSSNGA